MPKGKITESGGAPAPPTDATAIDDPRAFFRLNHEMSNRAIARATGVSEKTVRRWRTKDIVPTGTVQIGRLEVTVWR